MLPGAYERYIEIAEGNPGSFQTMEFMRAKMLAPDPVVDAAVSAFQGVSNVVVFEWVRSHMIYTPDFNNGLVVEEIKQPGYLLQEIAAFGRALGDCDDYTVLLGALYTRRGSRVVIVAVSRSADGQLDHVYPTVDGTPADGIVSEPFGWEIPASEITNRQELAV